MKKLYLFGHVWIFPPLTFLIRFFSKLIFSWKCGFKNCRVSPQSFLIPEITLTMALALKWQKDVNKNRNEIKKLINHFFLKLSEEKKYVHKCFITKFAIKWHKNLIQHFHMKLSDWSNYMNKCSKNILIRKCFIT